MCAGERRVYVYISGDLGADANLRLQVFYGISDTASPVLGSCVNDGCIVFMSAQWRLVRAACTHEDATIRHGTYS